MIALSPAVSWLLFGACIAVGFTVYIVVAGGRRYRRMEEQAEAWSTYSDTWNAPPLVRVLPAVYDWAARDDFGDAAVWVWDRDEWERYP